MRKTQLRVNKCLFCTNKEHVRTGEKKMIWCPKKQETKNKTGKKEK